MPALLFTPNRSLRMRILLSLLPYASYTFTDKPAHMTNRSTSAQDDPIMPPKPKTFSLSTTFVLLVLTLTLTSCSRLITGTIIQPTVDNLQKQTDLDLVCEGAPAYLLMIDSMIASEPDNTALLRIGSQTYAAYTSALAECDAPAKRIQAIVDKARLYGTTLISDLLPGVATANQDKLDRELARTSKSDVPSLFWGTLAWLTWIQQQQGAPAAMADLVVVEKIMTRLLELDETYQAGAIHLFFGALQATRPTMIGGDPERSRQHFERALEISGHRFLLIQTTYAETYARRTQNKQLHDSLLREVIDFPMQSAPEYTLSNVIARKKAARLLEEDYFAE